MATNLAEAEATAQANEQAPTSGQAPETAAAETDAPETPAPTPVRAPVCQNPILREIGVPITVGTVLIHQTGPAGRVSQIIPEPIPRDPDAPVGNRHFPQPPLGPAPWTAFGDRPSPPLFQRPAPQHPFREGIDATQAERQRWRQGWYPYALNLIAIINRLIAREEARDVPDAAIVQAYVDTNVSINYDIQNVLEQNPDIIPPGGRQNAFIFNPTPHSYLEFSERILRQHQTQLEGFLGDGANEAWQIDQTPVRRYGEQFPDDGFREILHYRPQYLGASWLSRNTTMEKVMWWITVPVIILLSLFVAYYGIRLLRTLGSLLYNVEYREIWSNIELPQRPSWASWSFDIFGLKAYFSSSASKAATDPGSSSACAQSASTTLSNLNSTAVQSAPAGITSFVSQSTGSTSSAGRIFAEDIIFKVMECNGLYM